jgi:hypothetical protein
MLFSDPVNKLIIPLKVSAEQDAKLRRLQQMFALACNWLAPIVRDTRCWNRVALHHMTYRQLREKFPQMGSQMACNAIYSVSRAARTVYQGAGSPFNLARWGDKPVPRIQFGADSPVYFDRHTLSIKDGQLSMFTLDGRMRFDLKIQAVDEQRFHEQKLQEIVLSRAPEHFLLQFLFAQVDAQGDAPALDAAEQPEYVVMFDAEQNPTPTLEGLR